MTAFQGQRRGLSGRDGPTGPTCSLTAGLRATYQQNLVNGQILVDLQFLDDQQAPLDVRTRSQFGASL
ncbi:MAG: hypothetical protein IPK13_11905 [Deltaproteobacteria bacterium]|nr:hypothetical protein [Deltaproteobacteria bacterium]